LKDQCYPESIKNNHPKAKRKRRTKSYHLEPFCIPKKDSKLNNNLKKTRKILPKVTVKYIHFPIETACSTPYKNYLLRTFRNIRFINKKKQKKSLSSTMGKIAQLVEISRTPSSTTTIPMDNILVAGSPPQIAITITQPPPKKSTVALIRKRLLYRVK